MVNIPNFPRRAKWTQKCTSGIMERYRDICIVYKTVSPEEAHSLHTSKVAHKASGYL